MFFADPYTMSKHSIVKPFKSKVLPRSNQCKLWLEHQVVAQIKQLKDPYLLLKPYWYITEMHDLMKTLIKTHIQTTRTRICSKKEQTKKRNESITEERQK